MTEKRIYFFEGYNDRVRFNAGEKAVKDILEICRELKFSPISLSFSVPCNSPFIINKLMKVLVVINLILKLLLVPRTSRIIINYPIGVIPARACFWVFSHFPFKSFSYCIVVHDLIGLQRLDKRDDRELFRLLKTSPSSRVIVHTPKMKEYLLSKQVSENQIEVLGIFDYLIGSKEKVSGMRKFETEIIIAGNLSPSKAGFLSEVYKLDQLKFNLYGANLSDQVKQYKNVEYFGAFDSSQLISKLSGSFGLVWDSDSIDGLSGNKGEYQKYNAPHKLSLYLAAGFPVIISNEAAMADFILERNLGFTVNSLSEISERISELTQRDYENICENVENLSHKLQTGYFLKRILCNIE